MHLFQRQYETKNQLQEEHLEIHKYVNNKKLATKQPMGQKRNQKRNLKLT